MKSYLVILSFIFTSVHAEEIPFCKQYDQIITDISANVIMKDLTAGVMEFSGLSSEEVNDRIRQAEGEIGALDEELLFLKELFYGIGIPYVTLVAYGSWSIWKSLRFSTYTIGERLWAISGVKDSAGEYEKARVLSVVVKKRKQTLAADRKAGLTDDQIMRKHNWQSLDFEKLTFYEQTLDDQGRPFHPKLAGRYNDLNPVEKNSVAFAKMANRIILFFAIGAFSTYVYKDKTSELEVNIQKLQNTYNLSALQNETELLKQMSGVYKEKICTELIPRFDEIGLAIENVTSQSVENACPDTMTNIPAGFYKYLKQIRSFCDY